MDKTKQQILIAEACGWKWENYEGGNKTSHWGWFHPDGRLQSHSHDIGKKVTSSYCLPDYLNDLDAMHEAEKVLTFIQYHITYIGLLQTYTERQWITCDGIMDGKGQQSAVHATAAQRAEAFLKTLNLWED